MFTQEIVCPNCGKPAIVNVLENEGTTNSPCQKCQKQIFVQTGSDGKIIAIRVQKSDCIIVTACLDNQLDLSNEQREGNLAIVRNFRDLFLKEFDNAEVVLKEYYEISPIILSSIFRHESSKEILSDLYENYIKRGINSIRHGEMDDAMNVYYKFICKLKSEYL